MATVVDYASLTTAITDFAHRTDLSVGLYTDYFIQTAQNRICNDILTENYGNGIKAMEVAMQPTNITAGTLPVPSDFFSPKTFQVSDGNSDKFTLIWKAAAWIYDIYPIRQPQGLPSYIARDVIASAAFTASVAAGVLTVSAVASGLLVPGMFYTGTNISKGAAILSQNAGGTPGGAGTYQVSNTTDSQGSEAMTGGGNVFVFGPFPDSNYQVTGTYYSKGLPLSSGNTTNWMVLNYPELLLAACMAEAGKFLKDTTMLGTWLPVYEGYINDVVNADKAERWASSTMAIELG